MTLRLLERWCSPRTRQTGCARQDPHLRVSVLSINGTRALHNPLTKVGLKRRADGNEAADRERRQGEGGVLT